MSDPKFDLRQMVRLKGAALSEHRDIGTLPGVIERMHFSRNEVTVRWLDRGSAINLSFDDIEPVA